MQGIGEAKGQKVNQAKAWFVFALLLINMRIGAISFYNFLAPLTPSAVATKDAATCSHCHNWFIAADRKFSAAYPEFKPATQWIERDVKGGTPYRVYEKSASVLHFKRPDSLTIVPLSDGSVAVSANNREQWCITILR